MCVKTAARPSAAAPADLEARDRLVMEHIGLVKSLAHRLVQRLPAQVEMNDLVSVGVLGLIDAATRYKSSLGVPFDAFARRRIHGAMLDSLRELDWAPRSLRRLRRDVDGAIASLRQSLQREPVDTEIAAALKMTLADYEQALERLRTLDIGSVRQLDAPAPDGGSLLELCVDTGEGAVTQLERKELREHLGRAIHALPERERHIVALSYQQELTLAEIGEVIGVGESRVCQLRSQAVARLRATLRSSLGLLEVAS